MGTRSVVPAIHKAEDVEASEALMINALVEEGEFLPIRWGVSIEDIECYEAEWRFCERYQNVQGEAPPYSLLVHQFPDFPVVRGVGCEFAAGQLGRDAQSRRMRRSMRKASELLRHGDIDEAQAILAETQVGRLTGQPGHSIWEPSSEAEDGPKWTTPYPTLDKATGGGIGPAELWYLAGLAGHGKTMIACEYVAGFLEQGLKLTYLSLEVPTRTINRRVRRALATKEELVLLDAKNRFDRPDYSQVNKAVEAIKERIPGSLTVFDSRHGRVTPSTVKFHCANSDIVVVDHIGLMYTPDGRRAVDDWRLYATISNHLLEEKNASGCTILAAAQLNRTADTGSSRAPATSTMGGAYQLVQDGDGVVTMKRRGKKAMVHAARKVREGQELTWHSDFDVKNAKFGEISADRAADLEAEYPFDDDH